MGIINNFSLGNLDSERDWGHARDYVEAMWLILQRDTPDDYVIGTGEKHSVREFLEESAKLLGLNIKSNGKKGVEEEYLDEKGRAAIKIHPRYFRPAEVDLLVSDPTKARLKIGWAPKIKFKELVRIMTEHDLKIVENEAYLKNKGIREGEVAKKMADAIFPLIEIAKKSNVKFHEDFHNKLNGIN